MLIVDDHQILRQGLVGLLADEPDILVVGEAADGASALELCRHLHPEVVLMDLSLPGMGGIETTRCVSAEWPEVRVIGLSMHDESDMAAAMREAGAVDYVTKGGPVEDLVAAIRAARTGMGRP